jgi:hypothetical protein
MDKKKTTTHVFQNEQHFLKCNICQQIFDMRDLGQVFEHEHREDLPELKYPVYGQKINDNGH